jgi:hypothetical protein
LLSEGDRSLQMANPCFPRLTALKTRFAIARMREMCNKKKMVETGKVDSDLRDTIPIDDDLELIACFGEEFIGGF